MIGGNAETWELRHAGALRATPTPVPLCGVKLMVMRLKHVGSAHVGAVLRVKLRSGRAPGRSGLFFGAGAAGRQATKSKIYDDAGGNLINRIYTTFE